MTFFLGGGRGAGGNSSSIDRGRLGREKYF